MKRKTLVTLLLSVVLCVSMLLGGCGNKDEQKEPSEDNNRAENTGTPSTDPTDAPKEAAMWDGYYQDTSTGLLSFVRLNEDGTYYAKYFEGAVLEAGIYKVLDEEMEYDVDGGADGDFTTPDDNTKAKASKVVEMISYKTGVGIKVAYVDDKLCDMSLGGMANHRTLTHHADYAYNPTVDEVPIELYVFYAGNSMGSNFILSHNKTFVDVTGDLFLDGSWEMKEANAYTLVYSDGTKAVLNVGADGKTAVLAKDGGSELMLRDTFEESGDPSNVVVLSLTAADAQVGLPMGVNLRLDCYGDNTCKLIVEVAQIGAELEADKGTYSVSAALQYTFLFEKAGEVIGVPDYASATEASIDVAAAYQADVEVDFAGAVTPLSIDSELKGTYVMGAAAPQ